jgi:hypothetical protein
MLSFLAFPTFIFQIYWDISGYDRISLDMVGYDIVYLNISMQDSTSPDMIGYDNI